MKTTLKYGNRTISFSIPESAAHPGIRDPEIRVDEARFKARVLDALPEKLSGKKIAIVVADKTRLCEYPRFLPVLVQALSSRGADHDALTFFIAYGTHKRQTDDESLAAYGPVFRTHAFVHHDCRDKTLFTPLGRTASGTQVRVRKDLAQQDLVIGFGALSHHYFAGYGGGRKLFFPGLGFKTDIYSNHRLFLDRRNGTLSPGCRPGNLDDNPLAADLKDVDDRFPVQRIFIHGLLDSRGRVADLTTGRCYGDFLRAVQVVDQCCRSEETGPFDLVIASCGGFPKDLNFIQAHKAVNNAAGFVRDGGSLIVLAQCRDGVGSDTFLPWFEKGGFRAAFTALSDNYQGNGGTALSMMTKTARINVFLKTRLDAKICASMNVEGCSASGAQQIIDRTAGSGGSMAVIANASLLIR